MEWLSSIYWNNPVENYLVAAGIAFGALLAGWAASALLCRLVMRGYQRTESRFDDVIAGVGNRLVLIIIFLAGLHAAFRVLTLPEWLAELLWALFVVSWTLLGALFVSRLINGFMVHYVRRHAEQENSLLDIQLVPIIRSVVNVGVWVMAGLFALGNMGFNIGSILAGLGIGGLALAMASKDLLANIFGAFTILVQGPFRVGEAVKYQGYSGTVEKLSLRATMIRTYDGHLVSIPNSLATTSVIENISRRPTVRVLFNLGLEYGTSREKCDQAVQLVKQAVAEEPGTKGEASVLFLEFGDSALLYQVIYHIEDQDQAFGIRHAINGRIQHAFEAAGIGLAFQTLTVHQA